MAKLTALTEDTTPSVTDLGYSVKDPAGTPLSRKVTWQTVLNLLYSLTAKTTLTGADTIPLTDSAASNAAKKITWTNFMGQVAAFTATFTNKRITKRVTAITSHATPTINTDNCDVVDITALAEAITSMTTNLSGTPANKDTLIFEIKDNGTARAITWGASFVAGGVALPTTTVLSKILTVGFMYSTANSLNKWRCIASTQEA